MTPTDFAAAQERILERRRLREAEARNQISEPVARLPAAVRKLPYPLSRASDAGILLWDTIKGREGTGPAFRVGQVDAELLDEELLALLKGQVGEGLKYFGVRHETPLLLFYKSPFVLCACWRLILLFSLHRPT